RQMASAYQLGVLGIGRALAGFEIAFEAQEIEPPTRRCAGDIVAARLEAAMREQHRRDAVLGCQIEADGGAVECAARTGHGVPSDMPWHRQSGDLDLDDHPVDIEAELSGSTDFWLESGIACPPVANAFGCGHRPIDLVLRGANFDQVQDFRHGPALLSTIL